MKKCILTILLAVFFSGCGIDIKPGSCPNAFNLNSKGVVPVAIQGLEDRDVTDIDPGSVNIGGLYPLRFSYEDVSEPAPDEFSCPGGPDGFMDLVVVFDAEELAALLIAAGAEDGEEWGIVLNGYNNQTEEWEDLGIDTVIVRKKGKD